MQNSEAKMKDDIFCISRRSGDILQTQLIKFVVIHVVLVYYFLHGLLASVLNHSALVNLHNCSWKGPDS